MRKRWKRKSGYISPSVTIPHKELIAQDLFITPYYSDWQDWRDGMRHWFTDNKLIKNISFRLKGISGYEGRIRMNRKQKKLGIIRKKKLAMKKLKEQ